MNISNLIQELKRRNVFKVAIAYAIAGWLIIQIADTVFPAFEFPTWTTQFVIILVGIGFPLSIIFAWAFELTPEGLKKSQEVDITESVTNRTGKKLNGLIIGVLAFTVVFLLVERVFFAKASFLQDVETAADFETASIAVLPFADLSPNGDQEYFSDGLSEELLNVLAKVEDMKVAGRTSSFKFKGQNENLKLIGAELDVDHILEGSVRKAGNTIRITAQLIKVDDGFHVWSETYDREYTAENIFRIQDEISQMVLNELKVILLADSEPIVSDKPLPTEDIEAYEAYLKGIELIRDRKPDEIEQAIEEFKRATEIDPGFAKAYAELSFAYVLQYEYGSIEKEEVLDLIRSSADRALFINPEIAKAYVGLSNFYELKEDSTNSLSAIERALELNPKDATIVNSYAVLLEKYQFKNPSYESRSDSLYSVAYELDPLNPVIATNLAITYRSEKNIDKALELLDKTVEDNPDFLRAYTQKIYILRSEGFGLRDQDFMEAYKGYQKNPESLDFNILLRQSATYFGLDSLENFLLNEVIRLYPNNPLATNTIRVLQRDTMNTLMENQKFEEAKAYAEIIFAEFIERDREGFEKFILNRESSNLFNNHFINEEYEQAFQILKNDYPEYLTDTLTTHPESVMETHRIKYLFKQIGRDDLVENLSKLEFEFPRFIEFNHGKDPSKEEPRLVYWLAMEKMYNNDNDGYADIVEELYFNRKYNFYQWSDFFDEPHEIEMLEQSSKLRKLIDRIEADQKRMKDNVVAFLKEEGAWKDSWEEDEE